MSELIHDDPGRLQQLYSFADRLIRGENGRKLIEAYRPWIDTVTPGETMAVFDWLLQQDFGLEEVKNSTGKIMNVFFRSLNAIQYEKPEEGHFLHFLMLENQEARKLIDSLKTVVKQFDVTGPPETGSVLNQIKTMIAALKRYELHYIKKENILFPYLERTYNQHRCLQLMWSFHDDFRKYIRILESMLKEDSIEPRLFIRELGHLLFVILPVMFREEQVIFPVALRTIPEQDWKDMQQQADEVGWCFINAPETARELIAKEMLPAGMVGLSTGTLTAEQLQLMLNHLPVDITFVDEHDSVCFYSSPPHRIFPRSPAIIGRKVQQCHPPESVHIVNRIVEAFRNGSRDHADFHIRIKDKYIQIRYFAVRDERGTYRGTIEVSQNVTQIRGLEGEKRLLDWENDSGRENKDF